MEQYKDIISELEELKKTKYINLTDLKQIDSIWKKLGYGNWIYDIVYGYCIAKEEGLTNTDEIAKWIKEEIIDDCSWDDLHFDYDGNYITDEDYELYWKYTEGI